MDTARLTEVAAYMIARDIPSAVCAVVLSWGEVERLLGLTFYSDRVLDEDERESCELVLGELYADVWQSVERIESVFVIGVPPEAAETPSWLVYAQPNNSFKPTPLCGAA